MTQTYRVLSFICGASRTWDGVQLAPVNGDHVDRLGADSIRLAPGHGLQPGDIVQLTVRVLQSGGAASPTPSHKGCVG